VGIATYGRAKQLIATLRTLLEAEQQPQEFIIHVDGGDNETPGMVAASFGRRIQVIISADRLGPGGGRNRIMERVSTEHLLSLDDDSWPIDPDFLGVAEGLMRSHPDAAAVGAMVVVRGEIPPERSDVLRETDCYENGAVLLRAAAMRQSGNYLPLRYAYGMEEADMALRMMDAGWKIYRSGNLRVFHDTVLGHHVSREVNAAHIANIALRAYLRYPPSFWPLGLMQTINRVRYAASMGRWRGIASGLLSIPGHCLRYRHFRAPVQPETIRRARRLAAASISQ
jgi:GT2 family glycosyltransferase